MKCAVLITARLKSTRLPLKVMREIHGKPMLVHLIDRLKLARHPEALIVCTSPLEQDDPLEEVAARERIQCYRGDPEDVLLRITEAAALFDVRNVISCTADNPFVDPEYIDRLLDFHLNGNFDYSMSDGLPFGTFAYALKRGAMQKACEMKSTSDTEVWGGYFTKSESFSWGTMVVNDPDVRWPELRLTVDTPEDFELVTRIFDRLYRTGRVFSLKEIVHLCRTSPDLVSINAHIMQKPAAPIRLKS